jgi:DNA-binding GntR family transcriptional regulator
MTVRRGLDVLRAEGVIVSHEKRGHFVVRVPGTGTGQAHSAEYTEVIAELRTVRDELRQVQQRLDQMERRTGPADHAGS